MDIVDWPDEAAFYDADTRRDRSREIDYGTKWHFDSLGVSWRVTWLEATGELVMVRSGPPAQHPIGSPQPGVLLLGWFPSEQTVAKAMKGWEQQQHRRGTGAWAKKQVRTHGVEASAVTEEHRRRAHSKLIGAVGADQAPEALF